MQGLISATRAAADALRVRAAEIDEVALRMAESRDPADVGQVIELVQCAVANAKNDRLIKPATKAT